MLTVNTKPKRNLKLIKPTDWVIVVFYWKVWTADRRSPQPIRNFSLSQTCSICFRPAKPARASALQAKKKIRPAANFRPTLALNHQIFRALFLPPIHRKHNSSSLQIRPKLGLLNTSPMNISDVQLSQKFQSCFSPSSLPKLEHKHLFYTCICLLNFTKILEPISSYFVTHFQNIKWL